jgi:hypothetical protein
MIEMLPSSVVPTHWRFIAILALATAACRQSTAPERRPPDFDGVILAVLPPSGAWELNLRIERSAGDTAVVWVDQNTRLLLPTFEGKVEGARLDQLTPGTFVEVWTTGAEYRSLPPQYKGEQLVVQ